MQISEKGISLIKHFEGCGLEAYQDSVGIWTIGYGTIKGVKEGDQITQDEAEHLLQEEMVLHQLKKCVFYIMVESASGLQVLIKH